jgi:hypothetical protein
MSVCQYIKQHTDLKCPISSPTAYAVGYMAPPAKRAQSFYIQPAPLERAEESRNPGRGELDGTARFAGS